MEQHLKCSGLPGLKMHREEKGLSVPKLAKLVGVHQNTIYSLEKGDRGASQRLLVRLKNVFDCSADSLLAQPDSEDGAA